VLTVTSLWRLQWQTLTLPLTLTLNLTLIPTLILITGAHGNLFLKVAMAKYKQSQGTEVPVNVRAVCPFSPAQRVAEVTDIVITEALNPNPTPNINVTGESPLSTSTVSTTGISKG
jgi:hypothetical protein